jgi:Na+-driven multidrug efflux pump
VNIVLDLAFVLFLRMDVTGVALATAIAMFISWLASAVYIRRCHPELGLTLLPRVLDKGILREIVHMGFPLGLNSSLYSVGHFAMQVLVNGQGVAFAAACSVGGKVNSFANVAIQALAASASTFSGQNYGAKKYDRLVKGAWRIPFFTGLLTGIAGLTVTALAEPIVRIFNDDPAVIALAVRYVRVVLPFCWAYSVFSCMISVANGMGLLKYSTTVNLVVLWVVRIPVAFMISTFFDGTWVMAAVPASFVTGLVLMLLFFRTQRWRETLTLARGMNG